MPPRIPVWQCLRTQSTSQASCASRAFTTTPASLASTVAQKRKHRDPYAIAQAKARKAANLSRQEVLKKERAAVLGDPVRGETTPFVRSFDTALPPEPSAPSSSAHTRTDESPSQDAPGPRVETDSHLNFFLSKDELESNVRRSKWLTEPLPEELEDEDQKQLESSSVDQTSEDTVSYKANSNYTAGQQAEIQKILDSMSETSEDAPREEWQDRADLMSNISHNTSGSRAQRLKQEHDTAEEALKRISSLSIGSSKDRIRVNVQRCIDEFGRHNTDQTLAPRPGSVEPSHGLEKFPRVGQDTGSSEVQIAILTAKIRALADQLELRGHPDKVNKRNLRLLVHRRAKLLNYLRRKERGGPRWQHLIEKLGLTEGTWKGEISL